MRRKIMRNAAVRRSAQAIRRNRSRIGLDTFRISEAEMHKINEALTDAYADILDDFINSQENMPYEDEDGTIRLDRDNPRHRRWLED